MTPTLLLAFAPTAHGATLTVCAVGCGYSTIRAAEAVAVDGDVIEVAPGTYPDQVTIDRAITIRGTGPGVRVGSSRVNSVFDIVSAGSVLLERLDFQDGDRCVRVDSSDVTIRDATFTGCHITSCCDGGGAIRLRGQSPTAVVEDSTFVANDDGGRDGGAIQVSAGALTVRRSSFVANNGRAGGAIFLGGGTGPHLIEDSTFDGNVAQNDGGAINAQAQLTVLGGAFVGNQADRGGAIGVSNTTAAFTADGVAFETNDATDRGGALFLRDANEVEVLRSDLCANTGRYGGGLYVENAGATVGVVEATTVRENSASEGAGIYVRQSTLSAANLSVLGNRASAGRGALSMYSGGTYRLTNSLVYDNTGYGLYASGVVGVVDWSAFGANTPADALGVANLGANSITAVSPDLTRYTPNADCSDDLLYPLVSSPLVDAGDPAILDTDGSPSDIGAFGGPLVGVAYHTDADGDLVRPIDGDCDDLDPARYPGALEVPADGVDQDCDGVERCWQDLDGDGFGTTLLSAIDLSCGHPGLADLDGDCLDVGLAAELTFPGAASAEGLVCATDRDGDGWGDDRPAPGVVPGSDCNDFDPDVTPDVAEGIADGVDQDCDGGELCFRDLDGDQHGTATVVPSVDLDCADPQEAALADDCDDAAAVRYPGAAEVPGDGIDQDCSGADLTGCYQDLDGDGIGSALVIGSVDPDCADPGESAVTGDCRDDDPAVRPGVPELLADGIDQDCDGGESCFLDADNDGAGNPFQVRISDDLDCLDPFEAAAGDDCLDAAADAYPGAQEIVADGIDQDCDGSDPCWFDGDGDGSGVDGLFVDSTDGRCDGAGEAPAPGDCDDTAADVFPRATEVVADGVDQDCNGGDTCFFDVDGDGEGTPATLRSADLDCDDLFESATTVDCDDTDPAIRPSAFEGVGDGVDQDCDGVELCFVDADGDGFGQGVTSASADLACDGPGEAVNFLDCDDTDAGVRPGAVEVAGDEVDQDCEGTEECWFDSDLDGFGSTSPVASDDLDCADPGESTSALDCDDTDAAVNPAATDLPGDVTDQDCDGDDACDEDGDGFLVAACRGGPGDCDDAVADPPESDRDGVPDACDVCPTVSDPDQADADGDGVGDACPPEAPEHSGGTGGTGATRDTGDPAPAHSAADDPPTDSDDPRDPTERVPGRFRADCGCAGVGVGGAAAWPAALALLALRRRQSAPGAAWRASRRQAVR